MSLVISRRVILGGKHPGGRQSELTGISSLLVGSYGASTVWFLRSYLRTICFKYAEFALVRKVQRTFMYLLYLCNLSQHISNLPHVLLSF